MTKENIYNVIVEYITENQQRFYRLAFSYSKNKDSALDIVQNAICKALERYADIRDISKINSWFYKVLINETYTFLKKHSREVCVSEEEMPEGTYREKEFDKDDELYNQIDALPKELKLIIILRFFEDMSLNEISRITNTNLNTVKTRLYSALRKLKKSYGEVGEDE